jgi:hypothetical protein
LRSQRKERANGVRVIMGGAVGGFVLPICAEGRPIDIDG